MTDAQRANGFVPEAPVAAEHLNRELYLLTRGLPTQVEGAALSNLGTQTSGTSDDLFAAFWHEETEQFLIAGEAGTLLTSPNGREWTSQTSGVATQINGIAGNASILVYVGASGVIRTSTDGVTWTSRTSGVATELKGVAWFAAASLFIAVGSGGVIRTSPDGITWTGRTSGTAVDLLGVRCSPTLAVAVGGDGFVAPVCTSTDGITWDFQDVSPGPLYDVDWSPTIGLFTITGFSDFKTSPDGVTWTVRTNPVPYEHAAIVATGRHFFAAGATSVISADGTTWYVADGSFNVNIPVACAWSGRVAVACGSGGIVLTSHRVPPAY